jgi:hypothetical protein
MYYGKHCEFEGENKCLAKKNGQSMNKCYRRDFCQYSFKTRKLWCKCPIGRSGKTCAEGNCKTDRQSDTDRQTHTVHKFDNYSLQLGIR